MRALLFDVFGTCVDWRSSIIRAAARYGLPPELAQAWRDQYQPQLETVRSGKRPWDAILGAEIARAYKPDPRIYRASVDALGLEPHEVCMVAAHRDDLIAASAVGLQTAFVPRPGEPEGPAFDADVVAWDFLELLE